MSRRVLLPILPLVLLVAGCGGATSSTPTASETPAAKAAAPSAPSGKGLAVGGTDLRLGGAVTDDGKGTQELAKGSRPDPSSLQAQRRKREGVGAGASCPDQDLLPTAANMQQVIASTLCLLNGERADAGLGPLSEDGKLAQAAVAHSQDMVANSYFAHQAPDGSTATERIKRTGYIPTDRAWTVGENLAWGTGNLATPKNIVVAWMNSQGHRENILRPAFDQIGFGVVAGNPSRSDGQGATYTTTFGSLGSGAAAGQPVSNGAAETPAATQGSGESQVKSATSSKKKTSKKSKARKARAARRKARAARARASRAKAAGNRKSPRARAAVQPR